MWASSAASVSTGNAPGTRRTDMGRGMNCWVGIGNLTRKPDLKYVRSGMAVCNFAIAVNESKKVGDKWEPTVQFFDITAWGKRGETVAQWLGKGSQVCVRGRIQQGKYFSEKKGHEVNTITVTADEIIFMGGRPSESSQPEGIESYTDRPAKEDLPVRDVGPEGGADPEPGPGRVPDHLKDPDTAVEEPLPVYDEDLDKEGPTASAGDELE